LQEKLMAEPPPPSKNEQEQFEPGVEREADFNHDRQSDWDEYLRQEQERGRERTRDMIRNVIVGAGVAALSAAAVVWLFG
jgi:hypothetical protein